MCVCRRLSNEAAHRHASANRMRALPWRCVCVCFLAQQTPTRRRRAEREERESVCVCERVFVSSLPGGNLRCSSCQNDTILRPHTHTQYEHTHAHQQYMRRILFFLHNLQSLHPSLLPSLALSFSLICSELNYTRMHTHIHADSKNTHTSLLSFPSELQSGR